MRSVCRVALASRIWHLLIALIIDQVLILAGGPDSNTGETVASVGGAFGRTVVVLVVAFLLVGIYRRFDRLRVIGDSADLRYGEASFS